MFPQRLPKFPQWQLLRKLAPHSSGSCGATTCTSVQMSPFPFHAILLATDAAGLNGPQINPQDILQHIKILLYTHCFEGDKRRA